MNLRHAVFAAAILTAGAAAAQPAGVQAGGALKPAQDQSIDLRTVGGDAYYTVENGGYHVVATFAQHGDAAAPMRFEAVLAPGQTLRFSTPNAAGQPANVVEIVRQNDAVVVHRATS